MTSRSSSSWPAILLVLLSILLLNTAPTAMHFPPSKLRGNEPIVNDDFPKLLYYTEMFRHHASDHGLGIAYDPSFFAGYRTNLGYATCQLYLALGRLFPRASSAVIIKGVSFLGILILPVLFALAVAIWRGDALAVLIGGLIGIVLTHFSNHYGAIWIGNVNSLASLFFVPIAGGLLLRLLRSRSPLPWGIALALCCTIAFLVHPVFPVFLAPLLIAVLAASPGLLGVKNLALVSLVVPFAIGSNVFWIVPLVKGQGSGWYGPLTTNVETMGKALGMSSDIPIALWYRNTLHCGLIVLAIGGALRLSRRKRGSFAALLLALTLYAAMHVFKQWYLWLWPVRIYVMLDLTLALLVALGGAVLIRDSFGPAARRRGTHWVRLRPLLIWICAAALVMAGVRWKGFLPNSLGRSPAFTVGATPQQQEVIDWLKRHADSSARVLLEDLYYTPPFGYRFAPLVAHETGLQFIGGPSANNQVSLNKIEFHVGVLAWKPIEAYDRSSLEGFVRTYNIGWVLAFSRQAVATFDRYPDVFIRMGEAGGFQTYRVARVAGYFEKGRGRVSASVNCIDLFDLDPDEGEVVLRYHYVQGLKTSPPVTMEPAAVPEDPQPFIRLVDPPARVTIYF